MCFHVLHISASDKVYDTHVFVSVTACAWICVRPDVRMCLCVYAHYVMID